MIRLDDHRICKRKSLGDCRECKEIGQVATPKRRRILEEITPYLGGNKRGKRTTLDCDTCHIPICKDGPY